MAVILNRTVELFSETTGEPVTLEEAKSHIRVVANDENAHIQQLIKVARKQVEADARRKYVRAVYKIRDRAFPCADEYPLEWPTVEGITSVSYTASTGNTVSLSTSVYELDANETPGFVRLRYNQNWPTTRDVQNAVITTITCGSTAPQTNTPVEAKQAILLMIDDMYCNRGLCGCGGTDAYSRLIGMLRWGDYR